MHVIIKGNYFNLDDVLVVSEIKDVGRDGAKFFSITLKNGNYIEFFYSKSYQEDVSVAKGNFNFGTAAFFHNSHEEILNILTDATQFSHPR
jgi:hypothetical protein